MCCLLESSRVFWGGEIRNSRVIVKENENCTNMVAFWIQKLFWLLVLQYCGYCDLCCAVNIVDYYLHRVMDPKSVKLVWKLLYVSTLILS